MSHGNGRREQIQLQAYEEPCANTAATREPERRLRATFDLAANREEHGQDSTVVANILGRAHRKRRDIGGMSFPYERQRDRRPITSR